MLLTTILNHVQEFQSFVFKKAHWTNAEKTGIYISCGGPNQQSTDMQPVWTGGSTLWSIVSRVR